MLDLKEVQIEDKSWIVPLLIESDFSGCHQNFTNIFAWSDIYHYHVAKVNNRLVVKGEIDPGKPYYFYPAGSGEIKDVLQIIMQDAQDSGHDFILGGISPENVKELKNIYPEKFEYVPMRDGFDYVYSLEKLATLKGNKMHSKKNHVNRFIANNSNWRFEIITEENIGECWKMNVEWCDLHKGDEDIELESCAVKRCFKHFWDLRLEGGLIRNEGKIIAYTMGEKLNSDTFVIHVEKAFGDIRGAYQMINREFAAYVQERYPEIAYVNREEDMGLEGLRKAKLSYHPIKMEEKYFAHYIKE